MNTQEEAIHVAKETLKITPKKSEGEYKIFFEQVVPVNYNSPYIARVIYDTEYKKVSIRYFAMMKLEGDTHKSVYAHCEVLSGDIVEVRKFDNSFTEWIVERFLVLYDGSLLNLNVSEESYEQYLQYRINVEQLILLNEMCHQ